MQNQTSPLAEKFARMTDKEKRNHNIVGWALNPGNMIEFDEGQVGEEWGSGREVTVFRAIFIKEQNGLYVFEPMNGERNPPLVKLIFPAYVRFKRI